VSNGLQIIMRLPANADAKKKKSSGALWYQIIPTLANRPMCPKTPLRFHNRFPKRNTHHIASWLMMLTLFNSLTLTHILNINTYLAGRESGSDYNRLSNSSKAVLLLLLSRPKIIRVVCS